MDDSFTASRTAWNAPTFFWKHRLTIKLVNTREKIIGQAEAWANRLQGADRDEE